MSLFMITIPAILFLKKTLKRVSRFEQGLPLNLEQKSPLSDFLWMEPIAQLFQTNATQEVLVARLLLQPLATILQKEMARQNFLFSRWRRQPPTRVCQGLIL